MVTLGFSFEASKENIKTLFIQLKNKFVCKTQEAGCISIVLSLG